MNFGTEILIIELIGIIAFAISGAIVAMKKNFDIFGIIVLGVITAVGGGAVRDIILGINPPAMFSNSLYVVVAFITSIAAFGTGAVAKLKFNKSRKFFIDVVNFFDAVGLGIFAVTGTNTAIINGHADNAFLAIFVGVVTGIGGGILRDILAGKIPFVLYKDVYASAAIVGATMYYFMYYNHVNTFISVTSSILITIMIRLLATFYHLGLPKITNIKIQQEKTKDK